MENKESTRDNAIYYPHINIPNSEWTKRTLLYWDKILTIAPLEFADNPNYHHAFTHELIKNNIVEQIFPQNYLCEISSFQNYFINFVKRKIAHRKTLKQYDSDKGFLIHIEKLGELTTWLVANNLAKKASESSNSWYAVDSWVAESYMSYLAQTLGSTKDVNAAPVTREPYQATLVNKSDDISVIASRDIILEKLIPYPDENISLDSLLEFKKNYGYLLPQLREKIEVSSTYLSLITDEKEKTYATKKFISECSENINEIKEGMSLTWNKIAFGTIAPLGSAAATLYTTLNTADPIAAGISATSLVATTYQSISNIPRESLVKNKPLAYIAFWEVKQ